MGMTAQGYHRLTYDEILESKISKAKEIFGEDIDTSELTPLGKYIRINAYDQSYQEESMEEIYYSRFPDTAYGISLDRICDFAGILRNPAIAAAYFVEVSGTAGYSVPKGFVLGTEAGHFFKSDHDFVIGDNGIGQGVFTCTISGTIGNVDYNEIHIIVNPDSEIISAKGIGLYIAGSETESDNSLRNRIKQAIQGAGSTNENAVRAALLRVPTVMSSGVIVNNEDTPDSAGRPPHTFECFVTGGETKHSEIAETIFQKKPLGIKTFGSISETVYDDGGFEHTIKFSHSTNVDVTVSATIRKNSTYEANGDAHIIENITDYLNGLGLAKMLVYSSLFGFVYSVPGVEEVTELKLSTDGGTTYTTSNIVTKDWEIIRCARVVVSYAE